METQKLIQQLENDIINFEARPFDIYILPAFMAFYAMRSKKGMSKLARRILFTSAVYMAYRSYGQYKEALEGMKKYLESLKTV